MSTIRDEIREILTNAGLENSKNAVDLIMSKTGNTIESLKKENESFKSELSNKSKEYEDILNEKKSFEEKLSTFGNYEEILNENKTLKEQQALKTKTDELTKLGAMHPDLLLDKIDFSQDVAKQVETLKGQYPSLFSKPKPFKVGMEQTSQPTEQEDDFSYFHNRRKQKHNRK